MEAISSMKDNEWIKLANKQLKGKIPIIGVGGVNSGKSAYEKIIAGASLLQLYTGFVYRGPSTAKHIKKKGQSPATPRAWAHVKYACCMCIGPNCFVSIN